MLNGDMEALVVDLKRKALDDTITDEEMREWIKMVREGRVSAAATSAASRARKAPVDTAGLLDEIDNL